MSREDYAAARMSARIHYGRAGRAWREGDACCIGFARSDGTMCIGGRGRDWLEAAHDLRENRAKERRAREARLNQGARG